MKKNILLIGFPGSGKTTIGKRLAEKLNFTFIDTDRTIENQYSMKLGDILNMIGSVQFKELEKKTLLTLLNKINTVISPGGSIIYYPDIMKKLKEKCCIVYLDVPFHILKDRLQDYTKRGIVIPKGLTLYELYLQRKPYYELYIDILIDINRYLEGTVDKSIDLIISYIISEWSI